MTIYQMSCRSRRAAPVRAIQKSPSEQGDDSATTSAARLRALDHECPGRAHSSSLIKPQCTAYPQATAGSETTSFSRYPNLSTEPTYDVKNLFFDFTIRLICLST
jgi:hypothetical protein